MQYKVFELGKQIWGKMFVVSVNMIICSLAANELSKWIQVYVNLDPIQFGFQLNF